MIADLDATPDAALGEYDLCIVGSGPAGMTVANELRSSGFRICVLESGLERPTARGDRLRDVESDGLFIKDYSRERVLGGASTTWAGLSSPMDPVDVEPRQYLFHSGWPISAEDLANAYEEAAERYRFPALAAFESGGFGELRAKGDLQPKWEALDEKVFLAAAEPQNFGKEWRDVFETDGIDLWLDASVVKLEGAPVTAARVRTRGGTEHEVKARKFVIATGGIENARLLLNSELGNAHDQVGRCMMNHPKNYQGLIRFTRPVEHLPYYFGCLFKGFAGYAGLRLSTDEQRERELLNSYVRLEPMFPWTDSTGVEALVLLVKKSGALFTFWKKRHQDEVVELRDYSETGDDSAMQNARKSILDWFGLCGTILIDLPRVVKYLYFRLSRATPKIRTARVRNFMEMEPDPDNRVVLSEKKDENGARLPLVKHRCTPRDRRSLVAIHDALASELERTGIGALEDPLVDRDPWPIDEDASHHMGTTRMGTDPETSVVDADLRVHGVDNLYMAGGSVFPSSGCANPTFTLVALSIRLARHLREKLA